MHSDKTLFMKKFKIFSLRAFILLTVFILSSNVKAQDQDATLIAPSLELVSVQKADKTIDCKVKIQAKVNGTFTKLPLLKVSIVNVTATSETPLGFAITDRNGKATINVKGEGLVADAEGKVTLKAVFAGNKQMDPSDAEVAIKRAMLVITPTIADSVYTISAKIVDISTGAEVPVPEAAIGLFVKRTFNPLKVGEGTTDINGEVAIEVPKNLPGNEKQIITLIGRLDENELYGNLEASVEQPWGTIISNQNKIAPRALWSNRVPIWMLVTFILLMTVVWGHYIVIIYELIRLRKEEPHTTIY
jgi:hypothetical protein